MSEMWPSELFDARPFASLAREGVVITYDWAPNPIIMAEEFDAAAIRMQDLRVPLAASRRITMEDVKGHFETQTDPDGNPWQELSPDYEAQKVAEGFGDKTILRKSDALYEAATNEDAYMIDGHDLFFDGASMPVYWMIHQWGGKAGKGATVPQRAYLGLSEEASLEVLGVFDEWIDQTMPVQTGVAGFTKAGEPQQFMMRGAGGRFLRGYTP